MSKIVLDFVDTLVFRKVNKIFMNTISVIVPVYNVEQYLRQCLDSIIAQTYRNLEIVLVDEYAQIDARIKVIHKENGGLSSARNAGLDVCTSGGDFVAFVDSDDWLEPDMYEILHDKMIEYKADIVNCGYYFEYKNHREKHAIEKDCVYEGDSLIEQSYSSRYVCYAVWFKLYRKTLFDLVRFPEGKNYEDMAIFFPVFEQVKKVLIIPDILYHYRQRNSSIMWEQFAEKQLDNIDICRQQLCYVERNYPSSVALARKKLILCEKLVLNSILNTGDSNSYLAAKLQDQIRENLKFILFNDLFGIYEKIIILLAATNLWAYRKLLIIKRSGKKSDFF